MTGRDPVDFVVGADPAADLGDEELAQPAPRSRTPWAVAGVAVVLTGILVTVVTKNDSHPSTASSVAYQPPPAVVSQTQQIQLPEGNRHSPQPFGCPSDAECYLDVKDVPVPTMTALRARFAGAQLTSASSVLANRTGRFGPDLVTRLLHARAGSVDITVTVRKPQPGDRSVYRYDRTGPLLHSRDSHAGSSFTVTVEIVQLGAKHRPSRAVLDAIARDRRLVVPQ